MRLVLALAALAALLVSVTAFQRPLTSGNSAWAYDTPLPPNVADALYKEVFAMQDVLSQAQFGTLFVTLGTKPRTVQELAVALLHKVVKKHFGDVKVVGAEIWTQIRKLDAGMHLHFDRDEKLYNDHNELITPFISSVVYLTDIGGPTIILEQQPGVSFFNHTTPIWTPFSPTKAEAGYAVYPHKNRCVFFQGDQYHGVLPDFSEGDEPDAESQVRRVTFLVNWWTTEPSNAMSLSALEMDEEVRYAMRQTARDLAKELAAHPEQMRTATRISPLAVTVDAYPAEYHEMRSDGAIPNGAGPMTTYILPYSAPVVPHPLLRLKWAVSKPSAV